MFGFTPDPAYYLAPFHPQAVHSMLGRVTVREDGTLATGFIPVHVDPPGRPRLCSDAEAEVVVHYVEEITAAAGLPSILFEYREGIAWIR